MRDGDLRELERRVAEDPGDMGAAIALGAARNRAGLEMLPDVLRTDSWDVVRRAGRGIPVWAAMFPMIGAMIAADFEAMGRRAGAHWMDLLSRNAPFSYDRFANPPRSLRYDLTHPPIHIPLIPMFRIDEFLDGV